MIVDMSRKFNEDSKAEITKRIYEHRAKVDKVMEDLAALITKAADNHDHTKLEDIDGYLKYKELKKTDGEEAAYNSEWFKNHTKEERHHLDKHAPDDVTLIDILETLADKCCDAVEDEEDDIDMEITSATLEKAMNNTVKLVMSMIKK